MQNKIKTSLLTLITAASLSAHSYGMDKQSDFVMIHSAWTGGWQWQQVNSALSKKGHTYSSPDLPGHGADNTPAGAIDLDSYVSSMVSVLDARQSASILVGHSFGGVVASQVAEARPEKVKAIVYLCAFMLPDGYSFMDATAGVKNSEVLNNLVFSEDKTSVSIADEALHSAVAHEVPVELFNQVKPNLVAEPTAPLSAKLQLTAGNYGSIPRYFVQCENDNALPVEQQQFMIEQSPVEWSYKLESSHMPVFTMPERVAEILDDVANREEVRKATLTANNNWIKAFNTKNIIAVTNTYTENAVLNARPFGTYSGREEISRFWEKMLADGASDFRLTESRVFVLDDKRATSYGLWEMNKGQGIIYKSIWNLDADGKAKLSEGDFEMLR
ncbi:alpha/beta fold hydrolase [Motiliproteus sp. MSK22-1]|uniref:alpha/beta fold hydrolase n=1 Tax=Motiliproteus sp. MSK22-1 TaxID=1897630 RepID=UPI000978AE76|nr:alpha/beta fold hydrolase [Motiliproteus sp. MSK22-1]OMH25565.1 hypothetical protein BGP75_23700 [Motiliproteus sp. MSK22-1]